MVIMCHPNTAITNLLQTYRSISNSSETKGRPRAPEKMANA